MIEKWYAKGQTGLSGLVRKLADRTKGVKPGIWVAAFVLALIAVQYLEKLNQQHGGYRSEIVSSIGQAGFFYGLPLPEHADSAIRYFQTSTDGLGLFVSDVATGNRRIVCQKSPGSYLDYVSPFSPDGALFAYGINTIYDSGELFICQSGSGNELARFKASNWHLYGITWLTPKSFVCRHSGAFYLIQLQPDGQWSSVVLPLQATIESGLDCISDDEFAWSDGGGLRAMNVSSGQVYPLWKPKTGQIVEATFSRQLNKFLITCKENQRYSLWQLKRNANGQDKVKQLASDDDIQNAQWLAGGDGFAYLKDHKLVIKTEIESQRGELASAEISHFICSTNDNLFFIGTVGNLPWDGLWCYNLASGTLTNVVSYTEKPSPYATAVYPHHWSAWWRGKALNYYIYYPAHFDRRKKYPLILGDSSLLVPNGLYVSNPHGPNWAEAIANCGAFVAFVYRPNWWWGLNKWDSDVQAFYEYLTRDPTIEKDKVFLFGTSAETGYMSRLIEERPELWKGAIFLNPGVLPNLSAVESGRRAPRILISAGAEEEGAEYFKKFQNEACSHGIAVEIQELPETGHYLVSTSAGLARTRAMVDFIFNN